MTVVVRQWTLEAKKQQEARRAIERAFASKNYSRTHALVIAELNRNPNLEYHDTSLRLRAVAHVNFPDFKRRVRRALANTFGSTSLYRTCCEILASDQDRMPDAYRFGRILVDGAVQKSTQKKLWSFLFLAQGAQMALNLGGKDAAVRTQTAAVQAADAEPRCPPAFRERLRSTLAKLKAAAGS